MDAQGSQPKIPFKKLNIFHGCNSVSMRWMTKRSAKGQESEVDDIVSPFLRIASLEIRRLTNTTARCRQRHHRDRRVQPRRQVQLPYQDHLLRVQHCRLACQSRRLRAWSRHRRGQALALQPPWPYDLTTLRSLQRRLYEGVAFWSIYSQLHSVLNRKGKALAMHAILDISISTYKYHKSVWLVTCSLLLPGTRSSVSSLPLPVELRHLGSSPRPSHASADLKASFGVNRNFSFHVRRC
jgi:hypothetical protein